MQATPTTVKVHGAEIRRLRIQAGLSTAELARAARLSARYLNHLENGYRTRMRPHSHSRLRQALGLPADSTRLLALAEESLEKR